MGFLMNNPFTPGGTGQPRSLPGGGWGGLRDFLQSPGGGALTSGLLGGIGQGLSASSQAAQQEKDRAMQAMFWQPQFKQSQAESAARMAPLGWDQNFLQAMAMKQGMFNKLLGGAGGGYVPQFVKDKWAATGYTPASMMPFSVDEGYKNAFNFDTSLGSISNWQNNIGNVGGGRAPMIDMARYAPKSPYIGQMQNWNQQQQQFTADQDKRIQNLMNQAINQKRGGFGSKLGGAAAGAGMGFLTGGPIGALVGGIGGLFR